MDFFPEIEVNALQAEAMARGLYGVALVDGIHEREMAMIQDFYSAAAGETVASLERVGPFEPGDLVEFLGEKAHRELFIKTALLLAWADGKVSTKERAKIAAFAKALDVSSDLQERLEAEVKDFLLRPLAALANTHAASKVAKKLGL
jgi:tellurite resistance protein